MKIVSVINYKGGVGKTSLTVNLAGELAWRGKKVLVIDLDAQASLTFSLIHPDSWLKNFSDSKTIKAWFDAFDDGKKLPLADLIYKPKRIREVLADRGSLSLICSHLGLINVDLELATKLGGSSLTQAKKNFISIHRRLADGLNELKNDGYDVILIDCPPNFNIVTKTAIIASDYILVPARPDFLSTLGIDYLIRNVNELIKSYNEYAAIEGGMEVKEISPKILGVVFTMIQIYGGKPISSQRAFMSQVRNNSGLYVYKSFIKANNTLFADAPQSGIPVVLRGYSNDSHTSVVEGLEGVTNEFCKLLAI